MNLSERERRLRFSLNRLGEGWRHVRSVEAAPGSTVHLWFDRDMGPEAEVDVARLGFDVPEHDAAVLEWQLYERLGIDYVIVPGIEWEGRFTGVPALPGPPHYVISAASDDPHFDALVDERDNLNGSRHAR